VPDWKRSEHVSFFIADQTYEWVGMKKRGRRSTVEHHNALGMPVEITHEVYVNAVHVHLPALLGTLSAHDRARIAANNGSAYTEPYNHVFQPLDFAIVDGSLRDLAIDALRPVEALVVANGTSPDSLSLYEIADGLFGRPNIDPGGPSEFDILQPLMKCDTKSYDDLVRIFEHLATQQPPDNVVSIFVGDGQSIFRAKDVKTR
jgi:hypothetical protein